MFKDLQKGSQHIMEFFSKSNLFVYCCVSAVFSMITYLAAFSCEISWILEAKGNLPIASYLLCAGFFILFVASTILIHGLVTGLSWGLFSWSLVIGALAIPELCLVMYMTIQYWGLQSTHGLTELIGYLIRLIVNCLALMCVIPTASKWRQEKKILSQLQSLAERLQLTTPIPNQQQYNSDSTSGAGIGVQKAKSTMSNGSGATNNNTKTGNNNTGLGKKTSSRRSSQASGLDNPAFVTNEVPSPPQTDSMIEYSQKYGSQNEFNASVFGLNINSYIGGPIPAESMAKRTQSLLDLRYVYAPPIMPVKPIQVVSADETDHSSHTQKNNTKNKLNNDHIYNTIRSNKSATTKSLGRNCVSLDNLCDITRTYKNDLHNYNSNLMQTAGKYMPAPNYWGYTGSGTYAAVPVAASPFHYYYQQYPIQFYNYPMPQYDGYNFYNVNYNNPYINSSSNNNSRQSLGNASDDFRKYRDVAL